MNNFKNKEAIDQLIENLNESKMEELVCAILESGNDAILYASKVFRWKHHTFKQSFYKELYYLAPLFVDEFTPEVKRFIERVNAYVLNTAQKQRITNKVGGNFEGLELKNVGIRDFNRYVILSKDASVVGNYRATYFDDKGFICHISEKTMESVFDQVFREGYQEIATGALDAVWQAKSQVA